MEINATLKSVGSKMLFIFNKIPLVMRLSILFFFISIGFVMAESSYAQVTEISLSAHNQPIGAVLDAVESQSDFSFIYDSKLVNTTRKVTVEVKNKNIFDILNQLFSGSDVVYTVIHYCPLKIASRSLKLLEYSLLQEILMRNDLKS